MSRTDHMILQYKYICTCYSTLKLQLNHNKRYERRKNKLNLTSFYTLCYRFHGTGTPLLSDSSRITNVSVHSSMADRNGGNICLNVFIYTPKGFISHCEKCDQKLATR